MFLEQKKIYKNTAIALILILSGFSEIVFAEESSSDEFIEQSIEEALNPGKKKKSAKDEEKQKEEVPDELKDLDKKANVDPQKDIKSDSSEEPTRVPETLESLKKRELELEEGKKKREESKKALYSPSPSEKQEEKHEGYVVERDSSRIIKKKVSINDVLTLKLCYSAGISLILDEDIQTELQRVILDDRTFFDALDFENHRGVYIKLKQPIPQGKFLESAIRLVRKDNDKEYLINLLGVSCQKGLNPYPKVYYLQDKVPLIAGKMTRVMTPEDTIIELSNGYPRKNLNSLEVYDLVARSGSEWAVLGLQIKLGKGKTITTEEPFSFKVLDNLQISEIPAKVEYLPLQSKKASDSMKDSIARFRLVLNLNKQYYLENRYFYIMLIDQKEQYHQYLKVDTLPYIQSLRKRGFDI